MSGFTRVLRIPTRVLMFVQVLLPTELSPDLVFSQLLESWDYRCRPLCPTLVFKENYCLDYYLNSVGFFSNQFKQDILLKVFILFL